jgi:hypothetical protein
MTITLPSGDSQAYLFSSVTWQGNTPIAAHSSHESFVGYGVPVAEYLSTISKLISHSLIVN